MTVRIIVSPAQADEILVEVTRSASRALEQITALQSRSALSALWSMKTATVGCDPLDSELPLNLIEQLNQTFTYVASARATKLLFELHPELAPFTLNLGTAPGSDIESKKDGGLAAEVFAAVSTRNNRKLEKDVARVSDTVARRKYVFFMCPGYEKGRQEKLDRAGVRVWSVGAEI
jgi:hypothetical protein